MVDEPAEPVEKPKVDWTKVARKSKNKGKYGEKRTAELLMKWSGVAFRRTPNSGGYNKAGGVVIAGHRFCGDVICDDPNFAFCVEVKNRPDDFQLSTIATAPSSAQFSDWWYQCLDDGMRTTLMSLLSFKCGLSGNSQIPNDFLAVTKRVLEHLEYPPDAPKFVLDSFNQPVWIEVTEKVKNQKNLTFKDGSVVPNTKTSWPLFAKENPNASSMKIRKKLHIKLPTPYCLSWKLLMELGNPQRLFTKPTWEISSEYAEMQILETR